MIAFKTITIRNFRAYADASISFDSDSGVYLMSGGNGAGKSSFLNAINWCLYADTPFFATEDIKEVVNIHAAENARASVELFADIRGKRYRFYRETGRGAPGGELTVSVENNGDWSTLEKVAGQDAVRRILPKDLRHLFFFNGEQLKNIFSRTDKEHDLQQSVYRVSELDVIDSALRHIRQSEELYLKQIAKQHKNADKIDSLKGTKEELESRIEGHDQVIEELRDTIKDTKRKINELDKAIKDHANAKYILEKRDERQDKLEDVKRELKELASQKSYMFQENMHRLLLHDEFTRYSGALVAASQQGQIPPPIDPGVTDRILRENVCICGRHISEHEKKFIEDQHAEYSRLKELQYLTDGIIVFSQVNQQLPDLRYTFKDLIDELRKKQEEKQKIETDLKKIHESLEGIDEANLHDSPELRRTHLESRVERMTLELGSAAERKVRLQDELKSVNTELDKTSRQDTETQHLADLRQKAGNLYAALQTIKQHMEEMIRTKLQKGVWETFSSILPDTNFRSLSLDTDYTITLQASDGVVYNTGMLSTGQTKVLGLALAYALSKDLGYSDVPFLIDNLYGDIKDTHYEDMTKMISALASSKQIIIMDLNIERTERAFGEGVIVQKFLIERDADSNQSIISEIANE